MAKFASDTFLDKPLDYISGSVDRQIACSSSPASYTEAASTYFLAGATMSPASFTKSNGDTNGRKIRSASVSASVINTGDATHVAYVSDSGSLLIYYTSCTTQTLTASNTVNFPAWDIEIADPV